MAGVLVLSAPAPAAASGEAELETRLLQLVNEDRAAAGLPALTPDTGAAARARTIAVSHRDAGRMDHTPAEQLAAWYMPPHQEVAELLGHTRARAEDVRAAWLDSEYHRSLLRSPAYERAGFGVALDDDGTVWAVGHLLDAPPPAPAGASAPATTPGSDGPESPPQPAPTTTAPPPPPGGAMPAPTTTAPPSPPGTGGAAASAPDGAVAAPAAAPAPAPTSSTAAPGGTATPGPADASTAAAGPPEGGFRPGLAAAVSAPTLMAAAAVRRRRRPFTG